MTAGRFPLWRLDRRPLEYREAWKLQRRLEALRRRREVPDVLLLTEHPPVFTLGRRTPAENLLSSAAQLRREGAAVMVTDRGGDVTFHGPGQLVAYPVFDLGGWKKDVHAYLRALEAAAIETAARFGVEARRRAGFTGVWCGVGAPRKLAAIGVRVSRWIATHGLALNANTELSWFSRIIPCGIGGCRVTSLEEESGRPLPMERVADAFAEAFAAEFDRKPIPVPNGAVPAAEAGADALPAGALPAGTKAIRRAFPSGI